MTPTSPPTMAIANLEAIFGQMYATNCHGAACQSISE
ncbi:hypothetical protein [Thermosynechococcus sp. M98_K2018_005]